MPDTLTSDPFVVIEQKRQGYIRYRNTQTGRRWEVRGTCDRRGDCIIGAVFTAEDGEVVQIQDKAHLTQLLLLTKWQKAIANQGIDTPVTPEFNTCCAGAGLLTFTAL